MYKTIHLLLERRLERFCYRHYTQVYLLSMCALHKIDVVLLFNYTCTVPIGNDRSPEFCSIPLG